MLELRPGRLALGLAAGAAIAIAVIGHPESSPAPATVAPEPAVELELTAEAELPRLIRDPREVAVLVTNHGTGPVWVRDVELVTASFAPTGPVEKGVTIAAGAAKALSVVYGEGQCGGGTAPPLAPTTARLGVAAGAEAPADGRYQELELPLAHADERLASRLHADCAAQTVAAALDIRLVDWSSDPDGRLGGTLVVERLTGDQPIAVHKLTGSTLYAVAVERRDGVIGELPSGEARLEIPVIADAARCDGHAVADVKFPFRFRIWVTVGDAAELPTAAAFDPADQAAFDQMWQVRCGE